MNNLRTYEEFNIPQQILNIFKNKKGKMVDFTIKTIKETFNSDNLQEVVVDDRIGISYVYTSNNQFTGVLKVTRIYNADPEFLLLIDDVDLTQEIWQREIIDLYTFFQNRYRDGRHGRPWWPQPNIPPRNPNDPHATIDPYGEENWTEESEEEKRIIRRQYRRNLKYRK